MLTFFVRVVPGMAVVLIYNLVSWSFLMGILKHWTFVAGIYEEIDDPKSLPQPL